MKFTVGDIVHHHSLTEESRIVRVAQLGKRVGYIVSVNKPTGTETEALWWPREIKQVRERVRKYRTVASRSRY